MFLHSFIPKSEQKIPLKTETITEQSLRIFGTSHAYPFNNRPRFHASTTGSDFYFRRSLGIALFKLSFFICFGSQRVWWNWMGTFCLIYHFFSFVIRKRRFTKKISCTFQLAYTNRYLNNLITASQTFYRRLRNFHHWKMWEERGAIVTSSCSIQNCLHSENLCLRRRSLLLKSSLHADE